MPSLSCWRADQRGLLLVWAVALSGCGHSAVAPVQRVVLAPTDALGMLPEVTEKLEQAIAVELDQRADLRLVAQPLDQAAGDAQTAGCLDDDPCLVALGRSAPADLVLAVRVAGLGDTHVVRARLVDAAGSVVVQDLQETVVGGNDFLVAWAPRLVNRLLPPPRRPWYRQWWVWSTAAVVVAGSVTATVLAVTGGDNERGVMHLGDL